MIFKKTQYTFKHFTFFESTEPNWRPEGGKLFPPPKWMHRLGIEAWGAWADIVVVVCCWAEMLNTVVVGMGMS